MLPSLNDNLPKINGRNIVQKYNSVLAKAKNLSEEEKSQLFSQEIVPRVTVQWKVLEECFDFELLQQGTLVEKDPEAIFTVEKFIRLGQFCWKCQH